MIHQESNYHNNRYYHDIDLASYYNSVMALKLNDAGKKFCSDDIKFAWCKAINCTITTILTIILHIGDIMILKNSLRCPSS